MAIDNFPQVIDKLKDEAISLASATFKLYKNEAKADAVRLIEDLKENLENWAIQLAKGELSKSDFEFLVMGQKELIEMNALKQAGIALKNTDVLKNSILNLATNTIISLI